MLEIQNIIIHNYPSNTYRMPISAPQTYIGPTWGLAKKMIIQNEKNLKPNCATQSKLGNDEYPEKVVEVTEEL